MASWNTEELVFLPDFSSRKRNKSLHFLTPQPSTTDGSKSSVLSVSAVLADTGPEAQRLKIVNEDLLEGARTSGRFSQQVTCLQSDVEEV